MRQITESSATIRVSAGPISKQLDVFYNPIMKFNRDISILILNSIEKTRLNIADPLAGSGIRAIRFIRELKKNKMKSIVINDASKSAVEAIKKNLKINQIKITKKIGTHNTDANLFLLNSSGFDYIDIDPFGSPVPFLDAAIKRIARGGILAVTATDTAPLAGTYPDACVRKYWAIPLRNELMHEIGIRILIRKVQLIAAQYEKALMPLFSYSKDHYYRIFLSSEKSKKACDGVIKQHQWFHYCSDCLSQHVDDKNTLTCNVCRKQMAAAGPLWTGSLFDKDIAARMLHETNDEEMKKFLSMTKKESQHNIVGFYDLHCLASMTKKDIPRTEEAIKKLRQKGYAATPTQFSAHGIKTNASLAAIKAIFVAR